MVAVPEYEEIALCLQVRADLPRGLQNHQIVCMNPGSRKY
jgi:hypothetical protein